MADSKRAMRRSIYERDILPTFRNRLLTEIASDDLRMLCGQMKDRGVPATAVHVRDIVKLIFALAILHGEKDANPADEVGPASIATFVPKDRSLSPAVIRVMLGQLEHVTTLPTIRLGMKLFLLTMERKASCRTRRGMKSILKTPSGRSQKSELSGRRHTTSTCRSRRWIVLRATCWAATITYLHFFALVQIEGDRRHALKPALERIR